VNEGHFKEIDVALMYIEEARERAERAARDLRRADADGHLVEALEEARETRSPQPLLRTTLTTAG